VIKKEVGAWIWLTGSLAELSPLDRRTIEHAATVMALELLRAGSVAETAWKQSGEILSGLLTARGPASLSFIGQAEGTGMTCHYFTPSS